jgi:enoyl-CoA hydratase/carnithine racemase
MTVLLIDEPAPGVRRFTLNRPERRNALSRELVERLESAFAEVEGDSTVRVVVLRGSGSSFCAGADFDEHFRASGYDIGRTDLWERIESCRVPVVAAVQGWAVTGGFLLAYCCDVVVAADSARFRDTHALLGLVPTGGESQRMPRRLGPFIARDLMLTSRVMGAEEAHLIGFASRVVPGDQLDKAALEVATAIADNAARSVQAIKQLINVGSQADLGVGLRLEALRNQFGQANNTDDPERRARLDRIRGPR